MFLFTILVGIIILLILFMVLVATIGGAVGIVLFGDVIVCVLIMGFIIKKIFFKKKK